MPRRRPIRTNHGKWKWTGYISSPFPFRAHRWKNGVEVINWCSRDSKRNRGEQPRRWKDVIKMTGHRTGEEYKVQDPMVRRREEEEKQRRP
ncbi:unnamed protein product, partial [Brenthis ino]